MDGRPSRNGCDMIPWLTTFLMNPAMAVGTAAVASPILIHIFSRRRFRRIRWAAMEFLLDAQRKNRRRVRMEQLILLALRCLAVLLVALMIARPFVRTSTVGAVLGSSARTERIVLVDDSYSMGLRLADGSTVMGRATQAVKQIGKWISSESPSDTLTLIATSRARQPITALSNVSEENVRRLNDYVEALAPSQTTAHFPDAMTAIAELIRKSPTQANTAVYVVSDFQRVDWLKPPGSDGACPAIAPLAPLAGGKSPIKVALVDVAAETPANAAITDVTSLQPQVVAGVPARFEVGVANFTANPIDQVELSISLSQQTLAPVAIPRVQPGQVVHEPIEVTFPHEGADALRIGLTGTMASSDPLALDNSRSLGVEVIGAVNVLVVDGEPGADPFRDEVHLFKTALRPSGRAASGNDVTIVTEQELDAVEWSRYHLVVLANVARLSLAALQALEKYVEAGGGLVIFTGDLTDPVQYNRDLFKEGRGLLPMMLGEVVQAPPAGEPFGIAEFDSNHPILRSFAGPLASVLRQVHFNAFSAVEENAPASSTTSRPAESLVLARYSDPHYSPAIVLRPFGRGRVVLVTTSADQEWNDWASNFSYVPFVLELTSYASRPSYALSQVIVGAPLTCPADPGLFRSTCMLRPPGYPVDPEISLQSKSGAGEGPQFGYGDAGKTGIWSFELTSASGQAIERQVAVNPDSTESNLAHAGRVELEAAMGGMKFDYVRDVSAFTADSTASRQELWWPLLLAAIVVLMAEQGLAWYFGTRG